MVICALGSMLLVRRHIKLKRIALLEATSSSTDSLSRQIANLSEFCDANLISLRSRDKDYQSHLGPESTWSELEKKYGESWSIESGVSRENGRSTVQAGILTKVSPTVADWQTAVDTLGSLALIPGITIARFEMRTSGDMEHRSVDIIKIVIEINARRSPANATMQ